MRGVLPITGWWLSANTVVTWVAMGVMDGGGETPLSAVRPCGMGVTPKKALDRYGSPHLTMLYLLRGEQGDFEDKSQVWIGDTRG